MNKIKEKILKFFKDLEFNSEKHEYTVGKEVISSVSHFYKRYSEAFDADRIAGYIARSQGISKEEVLAGWAAKRDMACERGTRVHKFGELYCKSSVPEDGFEEAVVKYWREQPKHLTPILFELKMFSIFYGIAGTLDILTRNKKSKKFLIDDYKTNEDIHKNYKGKKLYPPFDFLLDTPYNKYQIQLSLYQVLFEQCGYEVEDRRIIWLKENGTYEILHTTDYTRILKTELLKSSYR